MICREWDKNSEGSAPGDEALEDRTFYAQNSRGDAVALLTGGGTLIETVRYSAYGVPFGAPAGDTDADGDYDLADKDRIADTLLAYDVRRDVNLDGVVDSDDITAAGSSGQTLGWGVLSKPGTASRRGYAGYESEPALAGQWTVYHARHRYYLADWQRWFTRDPIGYADGPNMYAYVGGMALNAVDPSGLMMCRGCGAGGRSDGHAQSNPIPTETPWPPVNDPGPPYLVPDPIGPGPWPPWTILPKIPPGTKAPPGRNPSIFFPPGGNPAVTLPPHALCIDTIAASACKAACPAKLEAETVGRYNACNATALAIKTGCYAQCPPIGAWGAQMCRLGCDAIYTAMTTACEANLKYERMANASGRLGKCYANCMALHTYIVFGPCPPGWTPVVPWPGPRPPLPAAPVPTAPGTITPPTIPNCPE